ncbi:hypothetical protein BIW11_11023, partial [Tropilaelaps mercedesae]
QLANQRLSLRVPPPCLPTDFSLTGVPTDQRDTTRQADSRVRLVSEPVRSTKRASKSPQPCCDLLTTRKKKLGYMAMTCCSSKFIRVKRYRSRIKQVNTSAARLRVWYDLYRASDAE